MARLRLLPLLVLVVWVGRVASSSCESLPVEWEGMCNPQAYALRNNTCYCTESRDTWRGGSLCFGACSRNGCGSSECGCMCEAYDGQMRLCKSQWTGTDYGCYRGIAACAPCAPGEERYGCGCNGPIAKDGLTPYQCTPGVCRACVAGVTWSATGVGPCQPCAQCPGFRYEAVGPACTPTTPATYAVCRPGYDCTTSSLCLAPTPLCPPQSFCVNGTEHVCRAQDAEHCPSAGLSASVRACLRGTELILRTTSASCTPCDAGKYSSSSDGSPSPTCSSCPSGTYTSMAGQTACLLCAAGTYADPSSSFSSAGRTFACDPCERGTFQTLPGQTACRGCAPGSYMSAPGSSVECTLCPPGTNQSAAMASGACARCSGGTYAETTGRTACAACPAGKTTMEGGGGAAVQDCVECPRGYWIEPVGRACVACDNSYNYYYYCPGGGVRRARQRPVTGTTFISNFPALPYEDYVLRECATSSCALLSGYFRRAPCTNTSDVVCQACGVARPPLQYVRTACRADADTVFGNCSALGGDMTGGGRCNPCPPGSTFSSSSSACALCPANTSKASSGNGSCVACPAGQLSAGGSSRCTVRCQGASFAPDGTTCLGSTTGAGAGVPRRVVAVWDAAHLRSVAMGVHLPDGTVFGVQNVGNVGGLLWRLGNSGSSAWLAAGDTTLGGEEEDGVGVAARLGLITGLALAPPPPPEQQHHREMLLASEGARGRVRVLFYNEEYGAMNVHTPVLGYAPEEALRMLQPMGVTPLAMEAGEGSVFLVADRGAHCVWRLATPYGSLYGRAWTATLWRGGQRALPSSSPSPVLLRLLGMGGDAFRLAQPTAVATLDGTDATDGPLLTELLGRSGVRALGFVLDVRGVWAFDAVGAPPEQTVADLAYVCGGGTANAAAANAQAVVSCAALGVQESYIVGLSAGRAGGRLALFLAFAGPSLSGVLVVALERVVALGQTRLLARTTGPAQVATGGLWWSGGGAAHDRLFMAEGGDVGQVVELGVGAMQPAFYGTGGGLTCLCDAGLYCGDAAQQCVPSPTGTYAPSWATGPRACPAGTVSGGPEGGSEGGWCRPCPFPTQFTTYTPGALVCTPRCTGGRVFEAQLGDCVPGCGVGQYQQALHPDGTGGGCAPCPLGTQSVGGVVGLLGGCAPCPLGSYGASPGVCALCPAGGSDTFFPGATVCTTTGSIPADACLEDGYHLTNAYASGGGRNGSRTTCATAPTRLLFQAQMRPQSIRSLQATAGGTLYVGTLSGMPMFMARRQTPRWEKDPLDLVGSTRIPFQLVEIMEDEGGGGDGWLFGAEVGGTCVWRVNLTDRFAGGTPWVGDCGAAGDMDGALASGVARLGPIHGLLLIQVESYTPVLLISTLSTTSGCASIRSASLYNGALTTFVGADPVRLPAVLRTTCTVAPYVMAAARGTEEVFFATRNGSDVWSAHTLAPRRADPSPLLTVPGAQGVVALCARGVLSGGEGGVLLVATSKGQLMALTSQGGIATAQGLGGPYLACAGRRVWWASSSSSSSSSSDGGGVEEAGLDALLASASASMGEGPAVVRGCVGGYVAVPLPLPFPMMLPGTGSSNSGRWGCAQVGLGQYTNIVVRVQPLTGAVVATETVSECKGGTFGKGAGGGSNRICAPCRAGFVSGERSIGCDVCTGAQPLALGDRCVDACPTGFYRVLSAGGGACLACPSGHTAPLGAASAAACVPCPEGQFSNATSQGRCAPCPPGTTSLSGSFRCVRVCAAGTCAPDGETCVDLNQDWDVITPVFIAGGGATMRAVAVGNGGNIFYSDGNTLMYFVDDCPAHVTLAEAGTCQREGANLLPPLTCPNCQRGLSGLVLTHAAVGPTAATTTRLLYAVSFLTHAVYRLPILYRPGSPDVVDLEATRRLLAAVAPPPPEDLAGTAARARFFFLPVGAAAGQTDQSGLDGWRLMGRGGVSGFADGPFATARLHMPAELELSADDRSLIITDFMNQRIRLADLSAGTLRTLMVSARAWGWVGGVGKTHTDARTLLGQRQGVLELWRHDPRVHHHRRRRLLPFFLHGRMCARAAAAGGGAFPRRDAPLPRHARLQRGGGGAQAAGDAVGSIRGVLHPRCGGRTDQHAGELPHGRGQPVVLPESAL
jgi:hypothetical protein